MYYVPMHAYAPIAVPSVTVTSTIKSSDGSSFIVIATDNALFSSAPKYSDCSIDTTKIHTLHKSCYTCYTNIAMFIYAANSATMQL